MTPSIRQSLIWKLVRRQHGVVARRQLLDAGLSAEAVRWRIAEGRLHPVHRGVYAVGRPELTKEGRFMAAVLACGSEACLSHGSAGAHLKIRWAPPSPIHVSVLADVFRHPKGIRVHRRPSLPPEDVAIHNGIPTTTPTRTLIDLAVILHPNALEAAVNEADSLDLIDPEALRGAVEDRKGQRGTRPLRTLLDRHTFRLTDSELERRFLRIVRDAGLPIPETQKPIAGRVDFYWPELNLVVETDSLRYHRTAAKQALDLARDQAHAVAGRERLRFSHGQIRYKPDSVTTALAAIITRLASRR